MRSRPGRAGVRAGCRGSRQGINRDQSIEFREVIAATRQVRLYMDAHISSIAFLRHNVCRQL